METASRKRKRNNVSLRKPNSNNNRSKFLKLRTPYTGRRHLATNTTGLNELTKTMYNTSRNKSIRIIRLIFVNGQFYKHVSSSTKRRKQVRFVNGRFIETTSSPTTAINWKPFSASFNSNRTYYFQIGIVHDRRNMHHAVSAVKRGQTLYFIDPAGSARSIISDTVANQLKRILRASKLIIYRGPNLQASNRTPGICVGISYGILRFLARSMNRNWTQTNLNRSISQFSGGSELSCRNIYQHLVTNETNVRYKR